MVPVEVTACGHDADDHHGLVPGLGDVRRLAEDPLHGDRHRGRRFSESLAVSYTANTNAGTVTACAAYAGSSTRDASSGTATFQIAKASSTTTVTCPSAWPTTGTAQTPCWRR